MNKTLLLIVALVLLIGGGAYFVMSGRTSQTAMTPSYTQNQETTAPSNQPKSLKDLLTMGQSQTCTFTDPSGTGGTVYVSNGKMRGDFSSVSAGQTVQSHMIVDGQTSYLWMDGQTTGYKMTVEAATGEGTSAQGSVDVNKKTDFSCVPSVSDSSMFTLPTNIEFTSFAAPALPSGTAGETGAGGANARQCAACDSVPEASKAQCKAALGCY